MSVLRSIEFGTPSGNDALSVRFGIEHGLFVAEGLDLSIRTVFGGPELAAAFDSGEIPIGSLGSPSGLGAIAAGKNFRVIGSGCRKQAHMYLGVRKDITDYQALKGKRIGLLSIGSCPSWILRKMLLHHGLDAHRDVTMAPLLDDYPQIVEFMEEGRIDACLATEPNLSIGEDKGVLDVWASAYDEPYLPNFQWIVRVAHLDFIDKEPGLVAAVLRACQHSAHYATEHLDDYVAFVAQYYGAPQRAIRRAMSRELPRHQLDGDLDLHGLQVAVDLLHEYGGIDRPMSAYDFTDLRFQANLSRPGQDFPSVPAAPSG